MQKISKTLYFTQENIDRWELFCEENFYSKRVLSKVMAEAMDEFMENFHRK